MDVDLSRYTQFGQVSIGVTGMREPAASLRRICAVFLVTAALIGLPPSFATAQDSLPRLTETQAADFTSVGRLGRAGYRSRQSCSGTLIAPDLVLTAGHCLSGGADTNRVFVAGWTRGTYVGFAKAREEYIHPRFDIDAGPQFDIGLIVLEAPIHATAPLPLADDALPRRVALMGYNRQVPHMLTGKFDCPIDSDTGALIRIKCSVLPGNSGGPIFAEQDGVWAVRGVVSARLGQDAIAVPVGPWVRDQVAQHLAGSNP